MRKLRPLLVSLACYTALGTPAHAEFLVSSAILEFTGDGPKQQDIELVSRSSDSDYVVAEVSEVIHPGAADESRHEVTDPAASWLLVTPDKSVLPGGGRKVLRFVLLKSPDAQEHIYRVAIKPVIRDVNNSTRVGLKILVGYEVLVIIRPTTITPVFEAERHGTSFTVTNKGNSNILFQNGQQCPAEEKCPMAPVLRAYPGQTAHVTLPADKKVHYTVWDGVTNTEKDY